MATDFNRIVVLGANGMLGKYISRYFSTLEPSRHSVVEFVRDDFDFDTSPEDVIKFLGDVLQFGDVVINCVGMVSERMASNQTFYLVNAILPKILANVCEEKGIRLAHITTDHVFSGIKPPYETYSEYDFHDTCDIHGMSKSDGDGYVKDKKYTATFRTSLIGEDHNQRNLVEWVKSYSRGTTILGYTNHTFGGVTCLELAKVIEKYLDSELREWSGEHMVYSLQSVTKYDIVNFINRVYDLGLNVVAYQADKSINRLLSPCHGGVCIDKPLLVQIEEMKEFDILLHRRNSLE